MVNNLNETELGEDIGIPVRIIAAMKLDVFKEKIGMVDPDKDRMVLIHGLGNDARNIGECLHLLSQQSPIYVVKSLILKR